MVEILAEIKLVKGHIDIAFKSSDRFLAFIAFCILQNANIILDKRALASKDQLIMFKKLCIAQKKQRIRFL
jgi:hypothetical protein